MDLHLLLGYPLVVVAGLEVLLGIMLLSQNPRDSRVNRAVAVFSFASAAFSSPLRSCTCALESGSITFSSHA